MRFPNISCKEFAYSVGESGSIPGSGRCLGEGNGSPLQSSCLGKLIDRGAWWTTVHGVTSLREEHDLATDEQHRQGIIAPFSSIGMLSFLNDLVFFPPILQVIQLSLNSCFFFFFAKILKRVFAS